MSFKWEEGPIQGPPMALKLAKAEEIAAQVGAPPRRAAPAHDTRPDRPVFPANRVFLELRPDLPPLGVKLPVTTAHSHGDPPSMRSPGPVATCTDADTNAAASKLRLRDTTVHEAFLEVFSSSSFLRRLVQDKLEARSASLPYDCPRTEPSLLSRLENP